MTEAELLELAEGVARQRQYVHNLGMVDTPVVAEDRVKSDARFMLARDKLSILEAGYAAALRLVWGAK